jgi:acetylornithine deacetylase/succinyl-diaminopimelate desuccinylase-like protein
MKKLLNKIDRDSLVVTASDLVNIPSPTGHEQAAAEYVARTLAAMGLQVSWQEVEEGRPNVLARLEGAGGGKTLMFNGHLDTSYSGSEPWLRGVEGFRPEAVVRDGHIFGLGISNMKGALACYVEAVRAIQDAGVRLKGDLLIAAVVGEIEKAQWGEFRGADYRGYAAGSRHLVSHGGVADMCVLGEPTEQRVVLAHYGTVWMRISTHGPFIHTAFSGGALERNSIVRMRDVLEAVLEWIPSWEAKTTYQDRPGVVNVGAINGGFAWRASRTPSRTDLFLDVRVPPSMEMTDATASLRELVRDLRGRFPEHGIRSEIYITAPGAEIAEDHELIRALDESHEAVFGSRPERDVVRWFSDASVLSRYGIATVNYGTSSGLPGAEGENLEIAGLVDTAKVYALTAAQVCGVA